MKFKVGDVVELCEEVDLYPHVLVPKGETGVVVEADDVEVVVALHDHHDGLDDWDNQVYFAADESNNPDQRPLASGLRVTLSRDVETCQCDIKQLFDVGHSSGCVDHPAAKQNRNAYVEKRPLKNLGELMDALSQLGIKV